MAKKQKKTDSYAVGKGNKNVKAFVDVGLGQLGFLKLSIDKDHKLSAPAPLGPVDLGRGSDLKGKLLIFETLVTDVSTMTNRMSVVIQLAGGTSEKAVTMDGEVGEDLDSILFQAFILVKE
jgi:hypothetical protein